MEGVTEYEEGMDVRLSTRNGRLTIDAKNEAGHNGTDVDLVQLLLWVQKNLPELLQRPWQGLTDEDLEFWTEELGQGELGKGVIRAVADHLKERNT